MTSIITTAALLMASTLAFALDIKETNDVLSIDARRGAKTYPCSRQKALPLLNGKADASSSITCRKFSSLPEVTCI